MRKFKVLVLAMAAFAAGCAPAPAPPTGKPTDGAYDDNGPDVGASQSRMPPPGGAGEADKEDPRFSPVHILMRYDLDHDGKITKAELQAGLKAEFDAADTNHDGKLEMDEVRAINDKRWKELASAASPLVDWNGDGVVDFDEFVGAPRALFAQLDANGDGVLSAEELNPRVKGKDKPKASKAGPGKGGQGGGQGGGGPGGPPPGN